MRKTDEIGSGRETFRVGILTIPGFALMSYACTVEPLRAANLLSRKPLYDVVHFGAEPAIRSSSDAVVERTFAIGDTPPLDLLLVVAGGDPFRYEDGKTFRWLRNLAATGVRIGGVSGGSVILARAGLMGGRRMTTHWEHASELAERFPDIPIERRLYVIDRDRVTCGGGTAPLDLMHALIASQHGRVFARLVSDWFLHTDIRAAAAPQRSGLDAGQGARSPHVVEAIAAMEDHIADPLTLTQLAMIAGVSPRHLNRLFSDTVGESAMEAYRRFRLDVAERLVSTSTLSIAEIAEATGFASPSHFSTAYSRQFGIRPLSHRRARAA